MQGGLATDELDGAHAQRRRGHPEVLPIGSHHSAMRTCRTALSA
jgi:hypothetical protein